MTTQEAREALELSIAGNFRGRVHNKTLTHYAAKLAEKDLEGALRDARPEFDALIAAVRAEEQAQREKLVTALDGLLKAGVRMRGLCNAPVPRS